MGNQNLSPCLPAKMSLELQVEIEVEVEADVEIEGEIEMPDVEIEIEAPQVEFEVEVEIPPVEVEMHLDCDVQAPIVEIEVEVGGATAVGGVMACGAYCAIIYYSIIILVCGILSFWFTYIWGTYWFIIAFGVTELFCLVMLVLSIITCCKGRSMVAGSGDIMIEVEGDAEIGGSGAFDVQLEMPVMEAPTFEVEVEIEAPQVEFEVEIEMPEVEIEVEVEVAADVEVELVVE